MYNISRLGACATLLATLAVASACGEGPRHAASPGAAPVLTVDARGTAGARVSRGLFGLGVDLSAATYAAAPDCAVFAGVGDVATLVRIGSTTADDYDWRTDANYSPQDPGRRPSDASYGCPVQRSREAASLLRVLDKVRATKATAVVVLNGEIDDPQSAYGLVTLIARRYGYAFARSVYWEIGNAPAQWRYFGVPLTARVAGERITCSPDQYAALVTAYAAAIKAALSDAPSGTPDDKEWPRIVADAWITNATDQSWTDVVEAVDTRYYPYTATAPTTARAVAASVTDPPADAISLDDALSGLRANLDEYSGGAHIGLFVGQWNIDADAQAAGPIYDSAGQAVFVASLLMHAARDGVAMAAWAPPLYGSSSASQQAPVVDGQRTPGLRAFAALRALGGATLLHLTTPKGLDGLAVRRPDGGVSIVLLRAASAGPATVTLRLAGGPTRPVTASIQTFAGAVDGTTRAMRVAPTGTRLALPAHSVVIVTVPPH